MKNPAACSHGASHRGQILLSIAVLPPPGERLVKGCSGLQRNASMWQHVGCCLHATEQQHTKSKISHIAPFFDLIPKKAVLQKHRNEDDLHQCAWSWIFGSRSLKHRPKYANIPKWKQDQRCALLVVSPIECGLEF